MNQALPPLHSEVFGTQKPGVVPIVLMHGWGNSIETVRALAVQLSAYTVVHALDLPGHGKSAVPDQVWGMNEFAECLKSFLDRHGLARVSLVGHSFGGKTAIKFSALYPGYVEKVVLIGASGIRPKPSLRKRIRSWFLKSLRTLIRFKNTRLGMKIYQEWYIPKFASRDYLSAGPMTRIFVKTVNEELHDELTRIRSECLLIWGEEDDESPYSVGQEMSHLIPHAKLIGLPHQGHHPFIGSASSLVVKYIRDFLFK